MDGADAEVDGADAAVDSFKAIISAEPDDKAVVRQHVLHGSCAAIGDDQHFALKSRIAAHFTVEAVTDVFVVGSSKLGFSIAPDKRWRPFSNTSDVDVAIVNHALYQRIWHEVDEYRRVGSDWPRSTDFDHYLALGWIRPDLLPSSPVFSTANEWFEFFRSLQSERVAGPYKVSAALYHDLELLIRYQTRAVDACRHS